MAPLLPISSHFLVGQGRHGWRSALLVALWLAAGTGTALAQAPVLTSLSPTRNQRNAPRAANVAVTFSQPMNTGAASAAAVRVFSQQRGGLMFGATRGTASVSGNTITFNPTTDFQPGETLLVTTTTVATATNGSTLARGRVHQFTAATSGSGRGAFTGGSDVAVGSQSTSVAVGDVDGDGDLDLLAANYNASGTVSVRLNGGDATGSNTGTFNNGSTVPVGASPWSVTVGDVDGDGDLDLLAANQDDNTVSVRLNGGDASGSNTGAFSNGSTVPVGSGPLSVAVGDVDGDGDLDLLAANFSDNTVSVRLNGGDATGSNTGVFGNGSTVAVGSRPFNIAVGDVDADGDLDLLAANENGSTVSVRLNGGDATGSNTGAFSNGSNVAVGSNPTSVAVADVDGDGDLDLLAANSGSNTVSVRLNGGDATGSNTGTFSNGSTVAVGSEPYLVAMGDVDADGDLDLLAANRLGNTVSVRLNGGDASGSNTGAFSGGSTTNVGSNTLSVAVGDVDADGDLDLLAANSNSGTVSVRLNQLPPTITGLSPTRNLRNAPRASSVAVTFDQPMSSAAASAAAVKVFSQQRGGRMGGTQGGAAYVSGNTITFNPTTDFKPGERIFTTITTAAQSSGGAGLAKGHVYAFTAAAGAGLGTFSGGGDPGVGIAPFSVAVGDVDGDGDLDLLTANFTANTVSVRLNGGDATGSNTGVFANGSTTSVGSNPISVALGDVDGDGDLDLLTANSSVAANTVSVRLNGGDATGSNTGVFANGSTTSVGTTPFSVAVGDVDGDGDLDLLTANANSGTVSVRLNGGDATGSNTGVFANGSTTSVGSNPANVALGDVDGDGDLDLLAANANSGTVSVRLNGGDASGSNTGVFTNGTDPSVAFNPVSVAVGDVDGDGDLDLVTASAAASLVSVRLNGGDATGSNTGIFSNGSTTSVGTGPVSVALGDVDGDGDLDLLTANFSNNTVSVRLNGGDATGSNTGVFANGTDPSVGITPRSVALGDMDGDGDLDLVTANSNANTVSVRFNQNPAAPVITALSPARNARNAPANANVAVTFDQAMSNAAASAASVNVFSQQRGGRMFGTTRGTAAVSGNTISFAPANAFKPGETVFVSTTTTAQSGAGSSLARGHVHQFTTAAAGAGRAYFQSPQVNPNPAVGDRPLDVAVGDVDGDGDIDFVAPNWSAGGASSASVRLNNGSGNFTPHPTNPNPSVGNGPRNLALGDVDGDGDLDLLTSNSGGANNGTTVSVLLNNGTGSFTPHPSVPTVGVGLGNKSITLGDVDGDGDLDFVTANPATNSVSIRLNGGGGNFTAPATGAEVAVGTTLYDVTLGDVDADGDLDVLTANMNDNTVSLRLNDGAGLFTAPPTGATVSVGATPMALTLGDVDGDGDLDLLAANFDGGSVSLRLNDGAGAFSVPASGSAIAVGAGPFHVTLADLDADGDLDLLTPGATANDTGISVRLNDGSGSFTPAPAGSEVSVGSRFGAVVAADVDGDADLDLVAACGSSLNFVGIRLNLGVPVLTNVTPALGSVGTVVTIEGVDLMGATAVSFNGTPATSFVVNSFTSITATVPVGATLGAVTVTTPAGTSNGIPFKLMPSLAVTVLSPNRNRPNAPAGANVAVTFDQPMRTTAAATVKVFSAQRGGLMFGNTRGTASVSGNTITFNPTTDFRPGETVRVTTTRDAMSSTSGMLPSGYVHEFTTAARGTGAGIFTPPATNPNPAIGSSAYAVTLADIDGDLDLDMLTARYASPGSVELRLNDGTGQYTAPGAGASVSVGSFPSSVTTADLDGDGDLDLLVTNFGAINGGGTTVSVRLNNGAGLFTAPATNAEVSVGAGPQSLAVGDIDGDGDLDFVSGAAGANQTGFTASVRFNDGTGSFTAPLFNAEVTVSSTPWRMALADVDADGDLDLLSAGYGNGKVSLRLNNGVGTFTAPAANAEISAGIGQVSLLVGDIDNDGDLDFLTANFYLANYISRRFNDGTGVFSAPATNAEFFLNGLAAGAALADVDADGDLDLLVTNVDDGTVDLWRNDGTGAFAQPATNAGTATDVGPSGIAVGDVDADGDLDFVTTNYTVGTASVRLNQAAAPTITALSPASGAVGTSVTITGTNFTGATAVSFNGTAAPGFVVVSPTTITVNVPSGTTTGNVTVTTPGGTSNGQLFTLAAAPVITALSPTRNRRDAPANASVAVTFDQSMSSAAASVGSVKVFSQQRGGRMSGTQGGAASAGGNTITFNPSTNFRPGETLFVSTTPAAQSSAGANLARGHVHQFTTATGGTGRGNFQKPSGPDLVSVGYTAEGMATPDVDGDGDLDLLTTNNDLSTVSVRLNDGAGHYTAPALNPDPAIAGNPRSIATGDVDGDGDLDFVVATISNDLVNVRLNDGTGNFTAPVANATVAVGDLPLSVALADMDADGDLDVITGNRDGQSISIRLNDGTGVFSGGGDYAHSFGPSSNLAVGDLDADGDIDLALTSATSIAIGFRFNDGNGGLTAATPTQAMTLPPYNIALADFDGDGDLDLGMDVVGLNQLSIRFNDGTGTFGGGTDLALTFAPTTMAVGDLDADGDPDVVLAVNGQANLRVLLNNGAASFTPYPYRPQVSLDVINQVSALALADVDGDSDLDVLSAGTFASSAGWVNVRLNQPAPPVITALSPTRNRRNAPVNASVAVTFDQPMSGAAASAAAVNVFSAQRGGRMSGTQGGTASVSGSTITFDPATNFRPGETVLVTTTPAAQSSTGATLVKGHVHQFTAATGGSGQGNFLPPATNPNPAVGDYPLQVALGDVDGDGDLDVVTATNGGTTVSVRLNNGAGSFSGGSDPAVGLIVNSLTLGDIDGDGDLDLLAAVNTGGVVAVRLNNGSGSFSPHPVTPSVSLGFTPQDVTLGDVDGDGDLDFVTANLGNPGRVCVRLNDGTGTFTAPATNPNPAVASSCRTVKLGDVDGDGDLDLVTANQSSVSVRLNDGTGNFTGGAELASGVFFWGLALGDIDGDGDLDIAGGGLSASAVSLFVNDGAGTFTPPATNASVALGASPRTISLVDVDADGDLDLLTANSANFNLPGTVSVRINDGTGSFTPQVTNTLVPVGNGAVGLATGDVDGDGDVDLVTSNTGANNVSVRLNQPLPPVITSFTPTSALIGAGVTITGSDFVRSPITAVAFNGTNAPGFTVVNATTLTVNVPPGATTGPITLTSPYGTGTSATPFTVLTTPVITTLSPTRNRRDAPANANVAVTFDQPMSGAAASAAAVRVFSQQRGGAMFGPNRGAASASGNTITFDPANDFRPGEEVLVTVTTDAQSAAGANLAAGHVYQFTAAAGVGPAVFGGGQNLTVSQNTAPALAVGDVDGDGDADLVTIRLASGPGTGVAVYLNAGTGTLAPHPTTPVSLLSVTSVGDMTLADLDADGDLDLLIGQRNAVLVLTNDGTGVFALAQSVAQTDDVNRVAVGDVDADGDLDAAVAVRNGSFAVLRNDGGGTFAVAATFTPGGRGSAVALADIDADGDLDLVGALSGAGGSGLVLRNDGTGTFGNATTLPGSRAGSTLADIDADGDLDLLTSTGGFSGAVSVQRNDGTGTFAAVHQTLAVGNTPEALTTADFNGDGHLDLLIANALGGTLSVRLNDGTGTFATTGPEINVGSQTRKPVAADLDGDGDLDVLAAGLFNNRVVTRFNALLDLVVSAPQDITGGSYNSITVTGTGTGLLTDAVAVSSAVVVQDGGTLNTNCQPLTGPGTFTLQAGATLGICDAAGISLSGATGAVQVTGARSFSPDARYRYNGTGAQVTGGGLPATVRELIADNPTTVSLTQPVGISRVLRLNAGTVNATEQTLTLRSDATRTAYAVHNGGLTTGPVTVQRYVGGPTALGFRHLSSPVQNTPVADLTTSGFTARVNAAYNAIPAPVLPATRFPNVFGFDETRGGPAADFIVGYYSPAALTDNLTSGRGWSVYMPGARTPDFVGALTTGDVTLSGLTRTGTLTGPTDKSGWHLFGNPYPQPIDWDLATVPSGMSNAISVYRTTGGQNGAYLTRANGIGSLPDGIVPLGQAFFGRVLSGAPLAFTFTNALRVEANPDPVARPAAETRPVLSLTLTKAGEPSGDETFVYAEAGATPGPDARFDGFRPGRNVGVPTLASLIGPDEAAVNGLPETVLTQPTTVELLAVLPAPGPYELRLGQWLNLTGVPVALLDRLTGTTYDLATQPTVRFQASRANEEVRGRFALVFHGQRVTGVGELRMTNDALRVWPNPARGGAPVRLSGGAEGQPVQLLDATGRVVRDAQLATRNAQLDLQGLPAGVYTVRTPDGRTARLVVE